MPFHLALPMEMGINACGVGLYSHMDGTLSVPYIFIIYLCKSLRTNVSMHQTNSSKSLKICGVVFCGNIFYFSRNDFCYQKLFKLPKIQTEAEFSILMSENFFGFPPFGGTRKYAHGGKGPFRTSH